MGVGGCELCPDLGGCDGKERCGWVDVGGGGGVEVVEGCGCGWVGVGSKIV